MTTTKEKTTAEYATCSGLERLHTLRALPEDIALIRDQNPRQRELHDGRPVVGWPKWAKDDLRSVIRYRLALTGGDVSAWAPVPLAYSGSVSEVEGNSNHKLP
jgi:hypothetical protein